MRMQCIKDSIRLRRRESEDGGWKMEDRCLLKLSGYPRRIPASWGSAPNPGIFGGMAQASAGENEEARRCKDRGLHMLAACSRPDYSLPRFLPRCVPAELGFASSGLGIQSPHRSRVIFCGCLSQCLGKSRGLGQSPKDGVWPSRARLAGIRPRMPT